MSKGSIIVTRPERRRRNLCLIFFVSEPVRRSFSEGGCLKKSVFICVNLCLKTLCLGALVADKSVFICVNLCLKNKISVSSVFSVANFYPFCAFLRPIFSIRYTLTANPHQPIPTLFPHLVKPISPLACPAQHQLHL